MEYKDEQGVGGNGCMKGEWDGREEGWAGGGMDMGGR